MKANELFFSFLGIAFILGLFYNGYQQTVRDNEHAETWTMSYLSITLKKI